MNAMLSTTIPLPAILDQPVTAGARRRIDNWYLTPSDLARFNALLSRLGRCAAPLDCDQLATAARELCGQRMPTDEPPSIRERMQRVQTASQMLQDPDWDTDDTAIDTARLVMDYASGPQQLIPDWVPTVGRLDNAIVVEAAWPRLAGEVGDYLDFCDFRDGEARMVQGTVPPTPNRHDWERARFAATVLLQHQRRVREHSYLPPAAPVFRIH